MSEGGNRAGASLAPEKAGEERRALASLVGIGLAHDLRNLLSVAETSAFVATRSLDADKAKTAKHLARISEVVREAQALLSATLAMSRGEGVPVAAVAAAELVASAIGVVGGDRTIAVEPIAGELRVVVARPLAAAALVNVLKNAREAGASSVRVAVSAADGDVVGGDSHRGERTTDDVRRRDDGGEDADATRATRGARIEIEVRDDGPGFPAGFAIATGMTTKANGHGLGLAMARAALAVMGAELTLANGADGGAVVKLRFARG